MLYPIIMNGPFTNCNTNMQDVCGIGPMEGHLKYKEASVTKHIGVDGSGRGHVLCGWT